MQLQIVKALPYTSLVLMLLMAHFFYSMLIDAVREKTNTEKTCWEVRNWS